MDINQLHTTMYMQNVGRWIKHYYVVLHAGKVPAIN
jgi:hypothetical protein